MEGLSLEGVLRQYINNSVNGLFTSMPGRVEKVVDLGEQRVDVQLLIDRVTPDDGVLKHPVILSVPLVFPGSKSSQVSFPVAVGDTVLCIFSQRSIDRFLLGANNNHRPIDFRKYSRNDCMAIPGLFSFPSAVNQPDKRTLAHSTDDTVVSHNIGTAQECEVRLKPSGDIIINSPTQVQVNCDTAEVNAQTSTTVNTQTATINASSSTTIDSPSTTVTGDMLVQGTFTYTSGMVGSGTAGGATASITGSIDVTNDVTASGVSLVNHTHTGDSGGTTSAPN